jgi:hypothetical protein
MNFLQHLMFFELGKYLLSSSPQLQAKVSDWFPATTEKQMNKESNLRLDAKAIETNTGIPEKKMKTKII